MINSHIYTMAKDKNNETIQSAINLKKVIIFRAYPAIRRIEFILKQCCEEDDFKPNNVFIYENHCCDYHYLDVLSKLDDYYTKNNFFRVKNIINISFFNAEYITFFRKMIKETKHCVEINLTYLIENIIFDSQDSLMTSSEMQNAFYDDLLSHFNVENEGQSPPIEACGLVNACKADYCAKAINILIS